MSLSIIDTCKIFINTLVRIIPVGLYTGSAMSGAVFQDYRGLLLFCGFLVNELLGLGIGRKNRIFFESTVESINDQNYTSFSNFDYCKVISTTKWLLERAADAQIGIMDAIEEGDGESEEDYSKSLEESMNDLLIAYPNLPNSIGDLSPGDF